MIVQNFNSLPIIGRNDIEEFFDVLNERLITTEPRHWYFLTTDLHDWTGEV